MNRAQIEARLRQLAEMRAAAVDAINTVTDLVISENRATTDAEATTLAESRSAIARADAEAEGLTRDLDLIDAEERASAPVVPETAPSIAPDVRVGREPLTYDRGDVRSSYFLDVARATMGQGPVNEARGRLERHAAEMRVELPKIEARLNADGGEAQFEKRDLSRVDGSAGEFVPPMWMMNEFIELSRGGRVTANLCRNIPLPSGTDSVSLPKVATGTVTAIQTADNAAVAETDITSTSVTGAVRTIAGQQDVALQVLEQSPIAFDEVVFGDLANDHAARLDVQVLNGSNASGQMLGILNIGSVPTTTYTDASPTVPELYPKLASAANTIASTRFRVAEAIIMHPRRWFWMLSQLDSANRPLVTMSEAGLSNALAVASGQAAEGPVGQTPFGPVYIDPNVPTNLGAGTNEDRILFVRPSELYLFEGAVRTRVLPEVLSGTLTVRMQLYSYTAFIPNRQIAGTNIVAGTGLIAPTF